MKTYTRLIPLLFSLAFGTVGSAQSVLKVYYADDLARIPGLIEISPGFTTVIDFWDIVTSLASAKGELFRIESAGPRVLLSAREKAGQTDLIAEVGGRTLLFTVKVKPGVGPRRYVIELSRPKKGYTPPASSSLLPSRRSEEPPAPKPPRTEPAPPPSAEATPSQPRPSLPVEPPVRWTTAAQVPSDGKGTVTVFFTLENRGERMVAVDPNRLLVTQGGERLDYTLKREPLRTLVAPGEAVSGLISLEGVRPGEIRLDWTIVEIGTGREFTLTRRVMPGTRIELEP